ncbi:MAG: PepSY-like domain-containing protein [Bacteroidetes bacterium]|nr:PepSY-like domain-containing protein [Bacteroidota bacterium]
MKKLFVLLVSVMTATAANAQKIATENVPTPVTTAFKAKFSIAEKTAWEMDYDNYVADFSVGKTNFSAKFDKEGKWIETVTYVKSSELPKAIKESLSKKYGELSAYKIEDARKIEKEKETIYEMEIIKVKTRLMWSLTMKGKWLKKKKRQKAKKTKTTTKKPRSIQSEAFFIS